ncbi:hypothetical protein KEJ36_03605 [Candidatus Bathyarchaeota archaeon]|nr:hypothetical protein [Candidatus Bathyarchaeota archaeon]MBS7627888.1 hypothetical protein [Candidatus Bathyarchaeota archaeon]
MLGITFLVIPNLIDGIIEFFMDFKITKVPNMNVFLLAPVHPNRHLKVYSASEFFSFALGLFQIAILTLRFALHSPLGKKAETLSNLVFWLGTGFLIHNLLNEFATLVIWFAFWAAMIMLIGASLVVRAFILTLGRLIL